MFTGFLPLWVRHRSSAERAKNAKRKLPRVRADFARNGVQGLFGLRDHVLARVQFQPE